MLFRSHRRWLTDFDFPSIGIPIRHNDMAILNEKGEEVREMERGEICIRGRTVCSGYFKRPDANEAAFQWGWFRSGDLGSFDEQGYMTLAGRLKETYRVGGEQVMPTEIEEVLTRHPDVVQAHVVPVPDERMGEAGCAWIVLRPDAGVTPDDLMAICAENLARFKVPRYVLEIAAEELPTTPSGRARKFLLSERAIDRLGLR